MRKHFILVGVILSILVIPNALAVYDGFYSDFYKGWLVWGNSGKKLNGSFNSLETNTMNISGNLTVGQDLLVKGTTFSVNYTDLNVTRDVNASDGVSAQFYYFNPDGSFITSSLTDLILNPNPLLIGRVLIGNNSAGIDYSLVFNGESSSGEIKHKEDENLFEVSSPIIVTGDVNVTEWVNATNGIFQNITLNSKEVLDRSWVIDHYQFYDPPIYYLNFFSPSQYVMQLIDRSGYGLSSQLIMNGDINATKGNATGDYLISKNICNGDKSTCQPIDDWGGGGTPAGADTQVQFNDGGSFGAEKALNWSTSLKTLFTPNISVVGIYSQFENKSSMTFLEDGSINILLDPIFPQTTRSQTLSPYEVFNGWKIRSVTGIENILFSKVEIKGDKVCLTPRSKKPIIVKECECLDKQLGVTDECVNLQCEDVSYDIDDYVNVPIKDKDGNILSLFTPSFGFFNRDYCVDVDRYESLLYKIGLGTIIIAGDTSYDSIDTNITQETGFAHLNISDASPYDSLVGYWNFDADDNATAWDFAGDNNDGTYTGNAYSGGSSPYGNALVLDGNGDYINAGNDDSLNMLNAITVSAWFKGGAQGNYARIVTKRGGLSTDPGWQIDTDTGASNTIRWVIRYNDSTNGVLTSITNVKDNNWHQVVGLFNGSEQELYVDGVREANITKTGVAISSNSYDVLFGATSSLVYNFTSYFNGSIDEVMIFNTSLNSSQILDIYNNQSARFKNHGEMYFDSLNFGTNNFTNISIEDCQENLNTRLTAQINTGSETDFVNCQITDYALTETKASANLTLRFYPNSSAGEYNFYSPIIFGNITFDDYGGVPPPPPANVSKSSKFQIQNTTGVTQFYVDHDAIMWLRPLITPTSCATVGKGGIYFDDTLSEPCFCDGTNWKQFDGGGNC